MSAAEDFTRLTAHRNGPDRPPPGWEPGHLVNHETGVAEFTGLATTEAIDPDEATILAEMRLDPGEWAIKPGSLQVRKWQQKAGSGEWCWYYRITAVRRSKAFGDLDDLIAGLRRRKRSTKLSAAPGGQVWATSDWQVGKARDDRARPRHARGTAGPVRGVVAAGREARRDPRDVRR